MIYLQIINAKKKVENEMKYQVISRNNGCIKSIMTSIVQFIYQGSVDYPKSKTNGFLAEAHEVLIQDLKCVIDPNESIVNYESIVNRTQSAKQNKQKASMKQIENESEELMQGIVIIAQEPNPLESSNPQIGDENSKLIKQSLKRSSNQRQEIYACEWAF